MSNLFVFCLCGSYSYIWTNAHCFASFYSYVRAVEYWWIHNIWMDSWSDAYQYNLLHRAITRILCSGENHHSHCEVNVLQQFSPSLQNTTRVCLYLLNQYAMGGIWINRCCSSKSIAAICIYLWDEPSTFTLLVTLINYKDISLYDQKCPLYNIVLNFSQLHLS